MSAVAVNSCCGSEVRRHNVVNCLRSKQRTSPIEGLLDRTDVTDELSRSFDACKCSCIFCVFAEMRTRAVASRLDRLLF